MAHDAASTKVKIPEWITKDNTRNETTKEIRNIMLRYLFDCPDNVVSQKARRLINSAKLMDCDPTYLFALYELPQDKGVSFREFDNDEEAHVVLILSKVLFPISPDSHSNARQTINDSGNSGPEDKLGLNPKKDAISVTTSRCKPGLPQRRKIQIIEPNLWSVFIAQTGSTISYGGEKSEYSKMKFMPPLPPSKEEKGRPGDIANFYSSPQSKYTGKTSDKHSLARHRVVYYAQCNIAQLNAAQGLECLINMINTQSLAGTFYLNEIFNPFPTLEEAFSKLFSWSRQSFNFNLFVREWRGLRISHFKNDNVSWAIAVEKLYERASTLQDQLDDVRKHHQLLTEVLENAVQD